MAITLVDVPSGAKIAVADSGGTGVPLVFSHGYMMNHTMFDRQVEYFKSRRRCIAWDARGHGKTEWEGDFNYWDSARDLIGLLDALGIDKCVHVGMSQGGIVGMRAALLAPERFYGIVQLSTQAGPVPDSGDDTFARTMADWAANGADQAKVEFLASFILGPGADHEYWHKAWFGMSKAQVRDATGCLMSIDALFDRLHEVKVPVATIHGLADIATSHELGLMTPLGVPDPRGVTLIPGGPHAVNITHPRRVNMAIEDFLDELTEEHPGMEG